MLLRVIIKGMAYKSKFNTDARIEMNLYNGHNYCTADENHLHHCVLQKPLMTYTTVRDFRQ